MSAEIDSPAHLVTEQVTEDTATISWDRVQAVIDRYMVNYTSVDGDTGEMEVGKNETTTTLTGLKPGIMSSTSGQRREPGRARGPALRQ